MEQKTKIDYFAKQLFETCSYLFKAHYNPVLMSWAFENPRYVYNSETDYYVRFKVNGFKHQGDVQVHYNVGADLFKIKLLQGDIVKKEVDDVYVDQLIDILDNIIEVTSDYEERVEKEYGWNK